MIQVKTRAIATPPWYLTATGAELISIVQYAVKVALKISIGLMVASPMIVGDGFHNLADILQAIVVIVGVWLKRQAPKGYPFKLAMVESLLTIVIGAGLMLTGFDIGKHCAVGLIAQWPTVDHWVRGWWTSLPLFEPVRVAPKWFWALTSLMSVSVAASYVTSAYQIRIGERTHEAAVVADGKETRADARVELVALVGVIAVQKFHLMWAEYALGLVVMYFVMHTAWEIFLPGFQTVLKRSLGVEDKIFDSIRTVPGVEGVTGSMKTFRIGQSEAVCIITVETLLVGERHDSLLFALKHVIDEELMKIEGIARTRIYITLQEPPSHSERVAYPCCFDGKVLRSVDGPEAVTHILVCDFARNQLERASPYELASQGSAGSILELIRAHTVNRIALSDPHGKGWNVFSQMSPVPVFTSCSADIYIAAGLPRS